MKASVLKTKNVIRIADGSIAGRIADFEFNPSDFEIQAVCLRQKRGLSGFFFREKEVVIDVKRIVQIGKDVIFIDLPPSEKR